MGGLLLCFEESIKMNIPICFKLKLNYYLNFVFPNKVNELF